jgi:oligopeptide/dipeptide ABC transporter ATP-binding protein
VSDQTRTTRPPRGAGDGERGALLEVEDLTVRLRDGSRRRPIVQGVSMSVRPADCVAVVGQSGAGKSMSVRAVLGLLDPRRYEVTGRIRLAGVDLGGLSARERRRHVARSASLVFQNPTRSLNPTMRVGWQIAEAMYRAGDRAGRLSRSAARERAVTLMADVGIADPDGRFHSYPHQLSGGMRQRIVIAIALARRPQIMFCDEPTSSLDVTTQATVMDLLDDMRRQHGIATLLVTHDLALATSRVDTVMVMHRGRVVEVLPATTLGGGAAMPYTRALVGSVPDATRATLPRAVNLFPLRPVGELSGCAFEPYCDRADAGCAQRVPELDELAAGHWCRCWHPVVADHAERGRSQR